MGCSAGVPSRDVVAARPPSRCSPPGDDEFERTAPLDGPFSGPLCPAPPLPRSTRPSQTCAPRRHTPCGTDAPPLCTPPAPVERERASWCGSPVQPGAEMAAAAAQHGARPAASAESPGILKALVDLHNREYDGLPRGRDCGSSTTSRSTARTVAVSQATFTLCSSQMPPAAADSPAYGTMALHRRRSAPQPALPPSSHSVCIPRPPTRDNSIASLQQVAATVCGTYSSSSDVGSRGALQAAGQRPPLPMDLPQFTPTMPAVSTGGRPRPACFSTPAFCSSDQAASHPEHTPQCSSLSSTINEILTFRGDGLVVWHDQHGTLIRVNDYTVLREIGSGVTSTVYQVCDADEQMFALKAVPRKFAKTARTEAQALKTLHHESIVRYFHTIDCAEYAEIFNVLEYVEGPPICAITPGGTLLGERWTEQRARMVFSRLVDTLVYMHLKGVIHRDIKPDNVLYDEMADRPVFIDFGSCVRLGRARGEDDSTRATVGAPFFRPPEAHLLSGETFVGKALDVWALGVVLHILLMGKVPYVAGHHGTELQLSLRLADPENGTCEEKLDMEEAERLGLSRDFRRLITRLLDRDLTSRMSLVEFRDHQWLRQNSIWAQCRGDVSIPESSGDRSSVNGSPGLQPQSTGNHNVTPSEAQRRGSTLYTGRSSFSLCTTVPPANASSLGSGPPHPGVPPQPPPTSPGKHGQLVHPASNGIRSPEVTPVMAPGDPGSCPSTPHVEAFPGFIRRCSQAGKAEQPALLRACTATSGSAASVPAALRVDSGDTSNPPLRPPPTPPSSLSRSVLAQSVCTSAPLHASTPGCTTSPGLRFQRCRLPDDVPPSPGVQRISSLVPTPGKDSRDTFGDLQDDSPASPCTPSSLDDDPLCRRCATYLLPSTQEQDAEPCGPLRARLNSSFPSSSPARRPTVASIPKLGSGGPPATPTTSPREQTGTESTPGGPQCVARSFNVLLACSDVHARRVLTKMLTELIAPREDWHCDVCADGQDAVDAVRDAGSSRYALVLMDLSMARTSGLLAASLIREWEQEQGCRPVPIVGMTGGGSDEDLPALVLSSGMNNAMAKPVDWRVLRKVLRWAGLPVQRTCRISADRIFSASHSYDISYRRSTEGVRESQLCFPLGPFCTADGDGGQRKSLSAPSQLADTPPSFPSPPVMLPAAMTCPEPLSLLRALYDRSVDGESASGAPPQQCGDAPEAGATQEPAASVTSMPSPRVPHACSLGDL
eukprot:TRINITY_DN65979_c0_g1_i1.p1 TRINITY_DN65979_c0_g1~~TRINITY_DN65979_c0_g1_i1.p1  ORF type:complete len:1229 (+),score=132.39 TRINITY_DN65979_c0_g1_i1:173-3859(+)